MRTGSGSREQRQIILTLEFHQLPPISLLLLLLPGDPLSTWQQEPLTPRPHPHSCTLLLTALQLLNLSVPAPHKHRPLRPQGGYARRSLCLDCSSGYLLAASYHWWVDSMVPATERPSLSTQSKAATFPSHSHCLPNHPPLSSSQPSPVSEIVTFYFFPCFLSVSPYENIRSRRANLTPSIDYVFNKCLTTKDLC